MFASSIVSLCEKSNTSNKEERDSNEYEYSLCESPDTVEMISTSSFTYESIGTMATSSPTPPLIHEENILSSMSPVTNGILDNTDDANVHSSTMHTMIQETIIETTSGRLLCPPGPPGSSFGARSEDDNNTDEDNSSTVSSSLNQLSTGESKCSPSYYSVDNTNIACYQQKSKPSQYHHQSAFNNDDNNVPIINSSRPSITFDYLDDLFNYNSLDSSTKIPVQHVDGESASENMLYCHPEIRLPHVNSWEENWLFKKERKSKNFNNYYTYTSLGFASESVRMFIPNPSQPAQACVGEIPVELLDDLSERHSPTATSLIFSDDDDDDENVHLEREQQDQHKSTADQVKSIDSSPSSTTKQPVTISSSSIHSPLAKTKCEPVNLSQIIKKQQEKITCNDNNMTHASTVSNIDKHSPFTSSRSVDDKVPESKVNHNKFAVKSSCASLNNQSVPRENLTPLKSVLLSEKVKANNRPIYPVHQMTSCENNIAKSYLAQVPPFVPLSKRMESGRTDPSFLIKPCDASVQPNILIQFCCRVKGTKPLGVAWFKGLTEIKNDDTFRTFTSGDQFCLEIKDTKVHHTDNYSCVVYNPYGEQWSDFKLDVKPRSPSVTCRKEGVHFGCTRGKAKGIKGSSVDAKKNKGQVPNVITQTWAERSQNEKNEADSSITPTLTHERKQNDHESTFTSNSGRSSRVQLPNSVGVKKTGENENTSIKIKSNAAVKDKSSHSSTFTPPAASATVAPVSTGRPRSQLSPRNEEIIREITQTESTTVLKIDDTPVTSISETCKSVTCTSPLVNRSTNLSKFKRDFFVPNVKTPDQDEEALNGLDEKVYHSSKVFISNNDNDSDTPEAAMTFSLTTSDSGAESVWSRKASSQEDALNTADLDEVSDDALKTGRTPSVAKLIRQFSRCGTNDSLYRSPTCTSTDSIYNDCNGKGIVPRTRSSNNNDTNQQVSSSKSYLTLSNLDSSWHSSVTSCMSRKNDNQSERKMPSSSSPTASAITSIASNEGYNSDDSAIGSNILTKNSPGKQSVEVLPINKGSRSITARASFWQMRCENGLVSDSNVSDTFPSVESAYD